LAFQYCFNHISMNFHNDNIVGKKNKCYIRSMAFCQTELNRLPHKIWDQFDPLAACLLFVGSMKPVRGGCRTEVQTAAAPRWWRPLTLRRPSCLVTCSTCGETTWSDNQHTINTETCYFGMAKYLVALR